MPSDNNSRDHNPLVIPILDLLRSQRGTLSEHEIITHLRSGLDALPGMASSPQLALFQTHFLVMNALYQLQGELIHEGYYLRITPLAIGLEVIRGSGSRALGEASDQPLSDYYLDWSNLENTGEQDVENLLAGFWQRFLAGDGQQEALTVLDLPADADWVAIQKRYRVLVAEAHPDRGGDARRFMQIREAYEVLSRCRS